MPVSLDIKITVVYSKGMDVYALDISNTNVNPLAKIKDIGTLLNLLIPILTVAAGLLFFAMLLVGAFSFLTSEGSPDKLKKAQGTLFSAVLGLGIVISAYLITKLIGYFFNIALPF